MKKLTKRMHGYIDGITSSQTSSQSCASKLDIEIVETLGSSNFQLKKTVRHGFPHLPSALAYDQVQNLLAIGTKNGSIRIFGKPGVDCHVSHEIEVPIFRLIFLVNEGGLISICEDNSVHIWNIRQKIPAISHTLKFNRERITYSYIPLRSKFLFVGTERGNVHVINVETFSVSGYQINWNKAIELSRKVHPGPVVYLCENPEDENKLLICFETGLVVLWDLKLKDAENRYRCEAAIKSVAWFSDGKQFMCALGDGSLVTWAVKNSSKPVNSIVPHALTNSFFQGVADPCRPINKLELKSVKSGDPFIIFSGGLPFSDSNRHRPSITVMRGKSVTVLEMEHHIVDFICLTQSPFPNEIQEPHSVMVLLQNDLVVIDLLSEGYPCFENPYPLDLHESPVTCIKYLTSCSLDLIPALYTAGAKSRRHNYSKNKWPVCGGDWKLGRADEQETIVTGHADGSLKFWDATAVTLQHLYKLKTSRFFEKSHDNKALLEEEPFAIQHIDIDPISRQLVIAGNSSQIIDFKFSKQETEASIASVEISHRFESDGYDANNSPIHNTGSDIGESESHHSSPHSLKVRSSDNALKIHPGFQPSCIYIFINTCEDQPPPAISCLVASSTLDLIGVGHVYGIAILDRGSKQCILHLLTADLYSACEPFSRTLRSPLKKLSKNQDSFTSESVCSDDLPRSPNDDVATSGSSSSSRGGRRRFEHSRSVASTPVTRRCARSTRTTPLSSSSTDGLSSGGGNFTDDKTDGSNLSRSRSSSMSSLEKECSESVQCLSFLHVAPLKTEQPYQASLWVGTNLGSVVPLFIQQSSSETRYHFQPYFTGEKASVFTAKGVISTIGFIDANGALFKSLSDPWRDPNLSNSSQEEPKRKSYLSKSNALVSTTDDPDKALLIVSTDKEAKVFSLPSQTCAFKVKLTETSYVVRSDIIPMNSGVCLACYIANGHIVTYSLPSLRPLMDSDFLPLTDLRGIKPLKYIEFYEFDLTDMIPDHRSEQIARTFSFADGGQAVYMCSPTELQRITVSADLSESLNEMLGLLFLPIEMPEQPRRGFFKGLFGSVAGSFDREELFGEASGKASKGLARHIPGSGNMDGVKAASGSAAAEAMRARQSEFDDLLTERGEKLSSVEDATANMRLEAERFSQISAQLAEESRQSAKWPLMSAVKNLANWKSGQS